MTPDEQREHRDRLLDVLLREELGGARPPDLSGRIARKARGRGWVRFLWPALAAAAVLLFVFGLWPREPKAPVYPGPSASGAYRLVGAATVERGATLVTETGRAEIELGGYCRVRLEPRSRLRIDGTARAESVFLASGSVSCEVEPGAGAFDVRTELGVVRVTGTKFMVGLLDRQPGSALVVTVLAGRVRVAYGGHAYALGPGATRTFEPARPRAAFEGFRGTLRGLVLSKALPASLTFKVLDVVRTVPESRAPKPEVLVGHTVQIIAEWEQDESGRRVRNPNHLNLIERFLLREESTLNVVHVRDELFRLGALSEDQLRRIGVVPEPDTRPEPDPAPEPESGLPRGAWGFEGVVLGTVDVRVDERTVRFKVRQVVRVGEANRAAEPGALAGRTVALEPAVEPGDRGAVRPNPAHLDFLRRVRPGQTFTLELRHIAGERFRILALSEKILAWLGLAPGDTPAVEAPEPESQQAPESGLPAELHGFAGRVRGKVLEKRGEEGVLFEVTSVLRSWEGNRAENPKALKGRTVLVVAPAEGGAERRAIMQRYIRQLKVGERPRLELRHVEGIRFEIGELTRRQEQQAGRGEVGSRKSEVGNRE